MNQKTGPTGDRQQKAYRLFVKPFLTADADEDREGEGRARRLGSRRQKWVIRNS